MKTSNKLLVGLIAFICLYTVAALAEIRIMGWPKGEVTRVDHTTNLSDFSYVKINNVSTHGFERPNQVIIKMMGQPCIKVQTFDGDEIPELKYHIAADTLVIDQFQNVGRSKLEINVNRQSLKGIMATNSDIGLRGQIDSLALTLNNRSQLDWRSWEKTLNIKHLQVFSNNSFLQTYNVDIENLQVDNTKSSFVIRGNTQNLRGSIIDSRLYLKQVVNMSVTKDSLSEIDRNHKY
ncbi:MAG: hypothetical protein OCD76_22810 [Reichenbachiella sp.]